MEALGLRKLDAVVMNRELKRVASTLNNVAAILSLVAIIVVTWGQLAVVLVTVAMKLRFAVIRKIHPLVAVTLPRKSVAVMMVVVR